MIVVILGPQGSGKGTQAKLLAKDFQSRYFEGGEILRQKARQQTPQGLEINRLINQEGKLVPDAMMAAIVQDWLAEGLGERVVFDGYPRNLAQYQNLKEILAKKGFKIDKVIFLQVSQATAIGRLTKRRVCPHCHLEYNLLTKPPRQDELCDQCRVKLEQRPDDTPAVIKKRLATYFQETEPVIAQARRDGLLLTIDGEQPIVKIHREILRRLK
jgi:adenylate kinase